ncbi:hypothetical protein ACVILK_000639 [Bradyrhizobium embrapense]
MTKREFSLGKLRIDAAAYGSQGNAVLGIRDSGKTYTATEIAEKLFEAGVPFTTFDPTGVWRFLRVPGAGRGYPVVVAGGKDGDLPLTVAGATEIVRAAMKSGVSLVLDLTDHHLSKADWKRIVKSCVRVMLSENAQYGLRHVFIEEAAEFVPQRVIDGDVYAEVEKLARIGGNSRLGYTLINQRSQEVSKAVLELCENLFLHRQKGKNALDSLSKWFDVAEVAEGKEIMRTLPKLPSGQCWAWMGGDEAPELIKVPPKNSFHPDRRALHGDVGVLSATAVSVSDFVTLMKGSLTQIEEEAKANDPKLLRAEIARLTAELAKNGGERPEAIAAARQEGFERARREASEELAGRIQHLGMEFQAALHQLEGRFIGSLSSIRIEVVDSFAPKPTEATPARGAPEPRPARQTAAANGSTALNSAGQKMLTVLDTNPPVRRTWKQVATLAGLKARGGHFNTGKKSLLESGLIVEEGEHIWAASPSAGAVTGSIPPAELVEMWCRSLSGAAPNILRAIYANGGTMTQAKVAEVLGVQPRGGHWNSGWKELRDNDVLTVRGGTAELTELFRP